LEIARHHLAATLAVAERHAPFQLEQPRLEMLEADAGRERREIAVAGRAREAEIDRGRPSIRCGLLFLSGDRWRCGSLCVGRNDRDGIRGSGVCAEYDQQECRTWHCMDCYGWASGYGSRSRNGVRMASRGQRRHPLVRTV